MPNTEYFWNRRIRLKLGANSSPDTAIEIGSDGADFKIEFTITKSRDISANMCDIRVYNLSPDIRQTSDNEYDRIVLEAGYGDEESNTYGTIFDGWIKKLTHSRSGDDVVSQYIGRDGGVAYSSARVNKTYDGNSTYRGIVKDISLNMNNIVVGDISGIPDSALVSESGRTETYSGTALSAINRIARKFDARANIENGVLDIISNSSGKKDSSSVPLISKDSGMIGSPSVTEKGINVRTFLIPFIRPNSFIHVVDPFLGTGKAETSKEDQDSTTEGSSARNNLSLTRRGGGVYRVNSVTYSGSNNADDVMICDIEAQKSDGYDVVRPPFDSSPEVRISSV